MADTAPGQPGGRRGGRPEPPANTAPSCSPLETAQELLQWAPSDQNSLRSSVPLVSPPSSGGANGRRWAGVRQDSLVVASDSQAPCPRLLHDGPRLLACHDLAGGYHEDRWVQVPQLPFGSWRGGEHAPLQGPACWHELSMMA